jgi:hypothetical protein
VTTSQIIEACFQRLLQFWYEPQPEILWPGLETNPPGEGIWLEPNVLPNEPENIAWTDESCAVTMGIIRILVHYRPGMAQPEPMALADALCLHFPKGLELGPVRVFKRAWQDAPVSDGDDVVIPVTVPYRELT